MKEDRVRSVKFYVMTSIIAILITSLFFVFFIDLTFPNLDQDFKRRLNQAGTAINILAALFLSYKFIQSERYQKRERIIYEKDKDVVSALKLDKHNIHDQLLLNDLVEKSNDRQEKLYEELNNIMSLDELDKAHILIGLVCVVLGSCFQIVGAG